ncbi:MAG: BamA/TamA family outer membrane protein, partial [Bacteroidetes bacterium]|nr:BamA/TamA family outer membrane protein [Bacteroidota bacterium]
FQHEQQLIETSLQTIVAVLQGVTFQDERGALGDRLRSVTQRLARAAQGMDPGDASSRAEDLERLRSLLAVAVRDLDAVRETLAEDGHTEAARQLDAATEAMHEALRLVEGMEDGNHTPSSEKPVLASHDGGDDETASKSRLEQDEHDRDGHAWDGPLGARHHSEAIVGTWGHRSEPFQREAALYEAIPAVRYNRVEGLVLGLGQQPLRWDDWSEARVIGQLGYAFGLEAWRYEIGAEVRLDRGEWDAYGLKLGAAYRNNTTTADRWKTSWLENSLAAFFFEHDFFDYYEAEGWSVYAVQRLTALAQVSVGYRTERHRALTQNTGWSVFGGSRFQPNLLADPGRAHAVLAALEAGQVREVADLPHGAALRVKAELAEGFGGDFDYRRYVADGRVYLPALPHSSLALRLRGGLVEGGDVPVQKQFTLGGIGSMRGYPQNRFRGARMLLGSAEYLVADVDLFDEMFDDLLFIGFVDAGWVGAEGEAFDLGEVVPSAGFGVGARDVRLEVAWPLRDVAGDTSPSVWLRIAPSF